MQQRSLSIFFLIFLNHIGGIIDLELLSLSMHKFIQMITNTKSVEKILNCLGDNLNAIYLYTKSVLVHIE